MSALCTWCRTQHTMKDSAAGVISKKSKHLLQKVLHCALGRRMQNFLQRMNESALDDTIEGRRLILISAALRIGTPNAEPFA